ncbi:hypothetical protein [Nonomuraea sp. SYSU D8015]|uniref:hypothetical protein n=1 Tax=Nonomuraea sp. SYSU D8015 TaxID=2593644 RepID=UPI001660B8BC|nr:hypothetical protein [Nonomuraea sp. SYSU D8015]
MTASVMRTWTEASSDETAGNAAKRSKSTAGQVEPSTPSIAIFVHDRCGGLTIIDVPADSEKDSTDWLDSCGGIIPGHLTASMRADVPPVEVRCGGDKDYIPPKSTTPGQYDDFTCWCKSGPTKDRNGDTCELFLKTPSIGISAIKGIEFSGKGWLGWEVHNAGFLKNEWLSVPQFNAQGNLEVYPWFWKKAQYKDYNKYILDNVRLKVTSKAEFRGAGGSVTFDKVPSITPGAVGQAVSSVVIGNKGKLNWRDPESGDNNFNAECDPVLVGCAFRDGRLSIDVDLIMPQHKKDPREVAGTPRASGWTPWRSVAPVRLALG